MSDIIIGGGNGQSPEMLLAQQLKKAVGRLMNQRAPMSMDVRHDVGVILKGLDAQARVVHMMKKLHADQERDLQALRQTLMVIAGRIGPLDVSYEEVEMLKNTDGLKVSECKTPEPDSKKFKRFEFVSGPADDAAPAKVEEEILEKD